MTPLHTILAHLVLEFARREDPSFDCELILGARAAFESSERLLRPEYWNTVRPFPALHSERGLGRGRKLIADWVVDHYSERPECSVAMMGNDTDWRHQLLASLLDPASLWLFEDGIGSYVESSPSTRTTRVVYRNVVYKPFLRKAYWNSRGLSHSVADRYFSLLPGAFPFRLDRSKMEVLDLSSSAYVRFLKQADIGFGTGPTAILTTQPLLETGLVRSLEQEMAMWRSLARYVGSRVEHVLVKPHPAESSENALRRADAIRSAARPATVTMVPAQLPAEVLYLALGRVDLVVGAFSTSLATAVLLLPGTKVVAPLNGPAFASRRGHGYQSAYRSALGRVGVAFLDFAAETRG